MERNSIIHFNNTPFIKISIPIAAGISANLFFDLDSTYWILLLIIICMKLFALWIFPLKWKWKLKVLQGIGILMLIFSFGGIIHSLKIKKITPNFSIPDKAHIFKIIEKNRKINGGEKYLAEVYQADEEADYVTKCYIYTRDTLIFLQEGDIIISNSKLNQIKNTSNPGSYDFQKQSAIKGIFVKASINNRSEFSLIGKDNNKIRRFIHRNQEWIVETLTQSLKNKENSGLAEAIIIGYREDLDQSLLDSYINTGVVHVIAISGLHVGLIFSIISLMINFIAGQTMGRWISLSITLPAIWWFTILTGSTASVVRSALMSTFIIIGNASQRKSVTLNSLMAAAFIQMIYNPDVISDLGFQLSYSAVSSILIFNPLISSMLFVENKFIKSGWSMVCVTLTAQLLTTPISIYHFHQFPVLFLLTNLVAVPISSILLIAEIMLCIANLIKLETELFSVSINFLIDTMNVYIRKIELVPFSVINNIFIGLPTFVLIYALFIVLFFFLHVKKSNNLLYLIITFSFTCIVYNSHKLLKSIEKRIVILNVSGQTGIMIEHGQYALLIANKELLENHPSITALKKQLTNTYWIEKFEFLSIPKTPSIITINSSSFLTDKKGNIKSILLITGNPRFELKEYSDQADSSSLFVADASNKLWKIQQWETEADKLLLRFHGVAENGPIILESQNCMFPALKK
jgi:competence protein ComEC